MGKHTGWRVYEDRGAHVGAAWDPGAKPRARYVSKRFPTATEARSWARMKSAAFLTRSESLSKAGTAALVADYLGFLADVRKRSPSHVANTKRALDGLAAAVPDLTEPRARDAAERWLAGLPVAPGTKVQYLTAAKSLCRWAVARDRLIRSPLQAAETERPPTYIRPHFTIPELRAIVQGFGHPYHVRACLMAYAGLRVDEAAHIRWCDVDLVGRFLTVRLDSGARVKRSKERMVPIQRELAAILGDLPKAEDPAAAICTVADSNDRRAFPAFLEAVGVPVAGRSPHSLRYSYAGMLTACRVPSLTVKAFMGHASVATTDVYARFAVTYLQEVAGWAPGEVELLAGASCPFPRRLPGGIASP